MTLCDARAGSSYSVRFGAHLRAPGPGGAAHGVGGSLSTESGALR